MSVNLKLNDNDAKLVAEVLEAAGQAAREARALPQTDEEKAAPHDAMTAIHRGRESNIIGVRLHKTLLKSYATPDEIVRIAHSFDTAVYANQPS